MAAENDSNLTRVLFRMHAELNEMESQAKGRPIYDEYEVCEISFPANKHTVVVAPATEFTMRSTWRSRRAPRRASAVLRWRNSPSLRRASASN